jgi:hypothetical protein
MLNTKYNIQTTWLALSILIACYLLLPTDQVLAQSISLGVNPPIIQVEAVPPANIKTPITIKNNASQTVDVNIRFAPFTAGKTSDGTPHYLKPNEKLPFNDPDFFEKVQLRENNRIVSTFQLAPKQQKQFSLHIGLPKQEPPGDYYFSVIFLSKVSDQVLEENQNASTAQAGIATNVLVSVGPKTPSRAVVEEFSAPYYVESGPVPFTVKLKNTSKHFIAPKGQIVLTNMFNQRIGKVELTPVNILSGTSRYIPSLNQDSLAEVQDTVNYPQAVWDEHLLVGPYKATLTLLLSQEGPVITRTIYFVGLPIQLAIAVVIIVVLSIIIRRKVKAKIR